MRGDVFSQKSQRFVAAAEDGDAGFVEEFAQRIIDFAGVDVDDERLVRLPERRDDPLGEALRAENAFFISA